MSLRPVAAQWFELLTSREELAASLDCLARTRSVQLQAHSQSGTRLPLQDLRVVLDEYETLARRYAPWWPAAELRTIDAEHPLTETPHAALASLHAWAGTAEAVVAELESLAVAREELDALTRLCAGAPEALPRLDRLAHAGPVLAGRVYALPPGTPPLSVPPAVLQQYCVPDPTREAFLLAVGPQDDMRELDVTTCPRTLPSCSRHWRSVARHSTRARRRRARRSRASTASTTSRRRSANSR